MVVVLQLATIISQSSVCPTASVMEDLPSMSVTVKLFCFVFVATRRDTLQKRRARASEQRENTVSKTRERAREIGKRGREKREREITGQNCCRVSRTRLVVGTEKNPTHKKNAENWLKFRVFF